MRSLIRIVAPHFVAGLILERQEEPYYPPKNPAPLWHAVDAAPILFYMVKNKWNLQQIGNYINKKGWDLQVLGVENDGNFYRTVSI